MRSDLTEIEVVYQTETALAICVRETEDEDDEDIWLPFSEIEVTGRRRRGGVVEITAPEWLLQEKGLI